MALPEIIVFMMSIDHRRHMRERSVFLPSLFSAVIVQGTGNIGTVHAIGRDSTMHPAIQPSGDRVRMGRGSVRGADLAAHQLAVQPSAGPIIAIWQLLHPLAIFLVPRVATAIEGAIGPCNPRIFVLDAVVSEFRFKLRSVLVFDNKASSTAAILPLTRL